MSKLDLLLAVQAELNLASRKHPPLNSAHEAYAVILEEVEEFWHEVMKKAKHRDQTAMYDELIQVAAMALRTIRDLGLHPEE